MPRTPTRHRDRRQDRGERDSVKTCDLQLSWWKERGNVAETTSGEQIDVWKKELAEAVASQQWKVAIRLCSWLRYALHQQGLSDPEVEDAQRQAKEALARQVIEEKAQQRREGEYPRLRYKIMSQIIHGDWNAALFSIEMLHHQEAPRRDVLDLLQEFNVRVATMLSSQRRQTDPQAAALGQRFDELVEQVGGGPSAGGSKPPDKPDG